MNLPRLVFWYLSNYVLQLLEFMDVLVPGIMYSTFALV